MSKWREITLGSLIRVKHGWPFKSELMVEGAKDLPIVVSVGNFQYNGGFRLQETTVRGYVGDYPAEYSLVPGDILLIMTCQTEGGEILGIPGVIPDDGKKYLHNQRLGKVVVLQPEEVSRSFLYWYFLTKDFNQQLVGSASGTKIVHTAPGRIEACVVLLPPMPEQEGIGSLLDCLGDKIDLLRRQNQTLDAMAETLFRQWFLEAAEDNWVEYSVGDFADHLRQGVIPGDQPSTDFLHFSLPAFDAGQRAVVEPGAQILSNKFRVPEGVLLVSKLNPRVSRVWPIDQLPEGTQALCSTEFQVLKPKKRAWFGYLYGLLTSSEARDALTMAASGTSGSHQRVRPEDILAIKTTLPNIDLAEQFSSWVEPLISKRQHNIEQMAALERTRDTLLPKLMSGEVRVTF
jgi:type I restriction enzyme, S subunit